MIETPTYHALWKVIKICFLVQITSHNRHQYIADHVLLLFSGGSSVASAGPRRLFLIKCGALISVARESKYNNIIMDKQNKTVPLPLPL